jgi:predicted nucleotidyltransferase
VTIPAQLARYLEDLVERLSAVVALEAAYVVGSGAYGAFERSRSDVDVVAVVPQPLAPEEKRAIVAAAEAIAPPARKLELVVYARGSSRYDINLNTGERVSFDPDDDPDFWFVLDRAIAAEHAVTLVGPPWQELFDPVPRSEILDALEESLDWHEANEPLTASSLLNTCRAWQWVETGTWASKPESARWFRTRVHAAVEAAR